MRLLMHDCEGMHAHTYIAVVDIDCPQLFTTLSRGMHRSLRVRVVLATHAQHTHINAISEHRQRSNKNRIIWCKRPVVAHVCALCLWMIDSQALRLLLLRYLYIFIIHCISVHVIANVQLHSMHICIFKCVCISTVSGE